QANDVIKQLSPRLVIPMHFKIPGLNLPITSVESFIAGKENVERVPSNTYRLSREIIPAKLKIVVLSPP
ncbi:MAG: hypothetical protein QXQ20_01630, partial [Candidatus Nezhaarchaeales archaeon]